jgi:hypothetical protein
VIGGQSNVNGSSPMKECQSGSLAAESIFEKSEWSIAQATTRTKRKPNRRSRGDGHEEDGRRSVKVAIHPPQQSGSAAQED